MSDETKATEAKSNPVKDWVLVALAGAEAAGSTIAKVGPTPGARAGGAIAAALSRLITGIVERYGAAGAAEAKRLLEELHAAGPQGITDAQLASDDEALLEEIRGWYVPELPENPFASEPSE